MPITEKQRELRRKHLGSTDIAEIFLGDPYKVWLSKVYEIDDAPTAAMRIGTILEDAILTWAQADAGIRIQKRNQYRVIHDAPVPIGAHIDAIDCDDIPVEAKSAGILSDYTDLSDWGEPGTDQVPDRVIIQCHVHMMAVERDTCFVPTLLGGRGFALYEIRRDAALSNWLIEGAHEFWQSCIVPRRPPETRITSAALPMLKRIRREPNKTIRLDDDELVDTWLTLRYAKQSDERAERAVLADILAVMGDAEAAELPNGRVFTYLEQTRRGYTVGPKTYRVPRIIDKRRLTHDGNRQGQDQNDTADIEPGERPGSDQDGGAASSECGSSDPHHDDQHSADAETGGLHD